MPFSRATFDDFKRLLDVYCQRFGVSSPVVQVRMTDGTQLEVLTTLDTTDTTVMFVVYDERVGIDPVGGDSDNRNHAAVLVPYDGIRSIAFTAARAKEAARAGFSLA